MQQFTELTRSWSDVLTTLSIGSLSLLFVFGGKINPDGSLSLAVKAPDKSFSFFNELSAAPTLFFGLIVLSVILAVGYFIIQFGEFLAILPELKEKGVRSRKRVERCSTNPALMLMFSNAYTSYRLLCGLGAFLVSLGFWLIISGAFHLSIQPIAVGLFAASFGFLAIIRFARYSFASLDWILFGDLRE